MDADWILQHYWDYKIPVDLDEMAQKMGICVRYEQNLEGGNDISGRYDIINGLHICSVRSTDNQKRQRFTLAHEIGHCVLKHGGGFRSNSASFNSDAPDPRERAANNFALALLIPKVAVDHLINKENIVKVQELSALFDVTKTAMKARLKQLSWF